MIKCNATPGGLPNGNLVSRENSPLRTSAHDEKMQKASFVKMPWANADRRLPVSRRMFEGFAHNHQVMVLGRQALDVLTASGSLRDGMWHYRGRLDAFRPLRELLPLAAERAKHRPGAASRAQSPSDHRGQAAALRGPGVHAGAGAAPTQGPILRPNLLR